MLPIILNNEAPNICTPCGGKCCKNFPGMFHPKQFGYNWEEIEPQLRTLLEQKRIQLDYWEGDSKVYFPLPTIKGEEWRGIFNPTWGGPCSWLGEQECTVKFEKRPWGCQFLEATTCQTKENPFYNKAQAKEDWAPYSNQLKTLGISFREKV